ncbi:MAG: DUF2752 domain-containing protein [Planctomycetes bacterium]|nr:DUF2752 domain-containing protein [Planctomycetota bacterium]
MRLFIDKPVKRLPTPFESCSMFFLAGGAGMIALQRMIQHDATFCPLRAVTTIPCPLCGGTRAVMALVSGDPPLAIRYNPLALILLAAMVYSTMCYLLIVLPWGRRPEVEMSGRELRLSSLLILAAFAANWVYVISAGMYKVPLVL